MANTFVSFATAEEGDFSELSEKFVGQYWNIVVARAVKAELHENNWNATYTFEVIEAIRGYQKEPFQIEANILWGNTIPQQISFDHDDAFFRNSLLGRCTSDEGQNVMPSFVLGWTYLIFMDAPSHIRSYEIIRREDDAWLQYVKKTVLDQRDAEDDIRETVMLRQMKHYVHTFLLKDPDIDKEQRARIIKPSFGFVRDNPQATNQDIEKFFNEQVEEVLKEARDKKKVKEQAAKEVKSHGAYKLGSELSNSQ